MPKADYGEAASQAEDQLVAKVEKPWDPTEAFRALDVNGDGQIDVAEHNARLRNPASVQQGRDIFALLDQDGNGWVTLKEFTHRPPQANFRRMDVNNDGYLDLKEFYLGEMKTASLERAQVVFRLVDRNADQRLSFEEFQKRTPESHHTKLDENSDGRLSLEEYERGNAKLRQSGRSRIIFAAWDRDGDGGLSIAEFTDKPAEADFHLRDENGDGKLSFEEHSLWAGAERLAELRAAFAKRDVDGDGFLTLQERTFRAADADFWRMDGNRDNIVDLAEFEAGFAGTTADVAAAREPAELDAVAAGEERAADGSEGGTVSLRSAPSPSERAGRVFSLIDLNGDGRMTLEEYRVQSAEARLGWFDSDGDGVLRREEFTELRRAAGESDDAEELFRARDVDGDGRLTLDELSALP